MEKRPNIIVPRRLREIYRAYFRATPFLALLRFSAFLPPPPPPISVWRIARSGTDCSYRADSARCIDHRYIKCSSARFFRRRFDSSSVRSKDREIFPGFSTRAICPGKSQHAIGICVPPSRCQLIPPLFRLSAKKRNGKRKLSISSWLIYGRFETKFDLTRYILIEN